MTVPYRVALDRLSLQVADRGAGPLLLLVHGFPLDHTMWRRQMEGLASTCRLIAPDLAGFGASDARTQPVLGMQHLADDLAELLDAMRIRQPITLCGLSMGGYIAFEFWKRHGERLERLILCDTRAAADSAEAAAGRRTLAAQILRKGTTDLAANMPTRLFAKETFTNQTCVVEQTRGVMLATPPATVAAALLGMADREDMSDLLPSIEIPTLVLCGEHDRITPAEEMRTMAAAMPHAHFVEIPVAGHMAPLESGDLVIEAIRDFLAVA